MSNLARVIRPQEYEILKDLAALPESKPCALSPSGVPSLQNLKFQPSSINIVIVSKFDPVSDALGPAKHSFPVARSIALFSNGYALSLTTILKPFPPSFPLNPNDFCFVDPHCFWDSQFMGAFLVKSRQADRTFHLMVDTAARDLFMKDRGGTFAFQGAGIDEVIDFVASLPRSPHAATDLSPKSLKPTCVFPSVQPKRARPLLYVPGRT